MRNTIMHLKILKLGGLYVVRRVFHVPADVIGTSFVRFRKWRPDSRSKPSDDFLVPGQRIDAGFRHHVGLFQTWIRLE